MGIKKVAGDLASIDAKSPALVCSRSDHPADFSRRRVADFFCGGGGFSEGFRQAGFNIVFAVDKWEPAVNTYKGNKPGVNVIQDDIIRISDLPDDEFNALIPDSEVIIGSPPCQSFSHSNKSGNADKSLGIKLIKAYLKIIARKKKKEGSILRYWVLENVPAVEQHIQDEYTASDLGLQGDFVLKTKGGASGKYNAKYYGAPTNRERYLCGEFPALTKTKTDATVVTLRDVLDSLKKPSEGTDDMIKDINYPTLLLKSSQITDYDYEYKLEEFKTQQLNQAMTGIPLRYKGTTRTEIVWRIPLDYLIYNKYNGRIGSEVLSYEKQNGELNAEADADRALIEKFLYESKADRNKTTMQDLLTLSVSVKVT